MLVLVAFQDELCQAVSWTYVMGTEQNSRLHFPPSLYSCSPHLRKLPGESLEEWCLQELPQDHCTSAPLMIQAQAKSEPLKLDASKTQSSQIVPDCLLVSFSETESISKPIIMFNCLILLSVQGILPKFNYTGYNISEEITCLLHLTLLS